MKKLILLFAVLAFVACGKDEPEQKPFEPDWNRKVILHAVTNYDINTDKPLLRSNGAPNIKNFIGNDSIGVIVRSLPNWNYDDKDDFLNNPYLTLEVNKWGEGWEDGVRGMPLVDYNFDTINNNLILPITEIFAEDGRIYTRILGKTEWIIGKYWGDIIYDTLGYIPLPNLYESQLKIKEYIKAEQYDKLYTLLENDLKIIWEGGDSYKAHKAEAQKIYPFIEL